MGLVSLELILIVLKYISEPAVSEILAQMCFETWFQLWKTIKGLAGRVIFGMLPLEMKKQNGKQADSGNNLEGEHGVDLGTDTLQIVTNLSFSF